MSYQTLLKISSLLPLEVRQQSTMASPISTNDLTHQLSQLQLSSTAELLESFTVFPKLPIELRLKIWKFALPMPRKRVRRILRVRARVSTTLKTKDYSRFFLEDIHQRYWDARSKLGISPGVPQLFHEFPSDQEKWLDQISR